MFRSTISLCSIISVVAATSHSALHADELSPAVVAAKQSMQGFRFAASWTSSVAATEPNVQNVVAFSFDEQGRLYLAETFRQSKGVEDNRGHMNWLLDDLAAQTVQDRLAFFKKFQGDNISKYAEQEDRVRELRDTDGDGVYEKATNYADGFHDILDGTGAGVLAWNGSVYYTCIPNLWKLRDSQGDGIADERRSLHSGYGVRVAFRGHDMHGLTVGPDGKLYYSIGDRGYHIDLPDGRVLARPDQGAVFRCNLDGSGLEEFATGLRNPQELAFDEFGNLFTGDNNSDGGDRARWVHVVEGGDSGWRMYYQYMEDRGPWNQEFMWHPARAEQPAFIVPPVANFADGPSGLTHDPGVGLPDEFKGMFFLADFRGSPANSGIRGLRVKPKGSSFELIDSTEVIWGVLATDVDFGYDGGLYVADWIDGWEGKGSGRMYRFTPPNSHGAETAALFHQGFQTRGVAELSQLLEHDDYRVRLRAQLALAEGKQKAALIAATQHGKRLETRLHCIWGLGQIGARQAVGVDDLIQLAGDRETYVRAQTAKVLGDLRAEAAGDALIKLLADPEAAVQLQAAIALGKIGAPQATPALFALLDIAGDQDPALRHAATFGLAGCATPDELATRVPHPSRYQRLGAVIALRRIHHPAVGKFLGDSDSAVVLEAARAVHDTHLDAAMPLLASLPVAAETALPLVRRIISANYLIGSAETAARVATLARRDSLPEETRLNAGKALFEWNMPGPLDRVTNEYHPLEPRTVDLKTVLQLTVPSMLGAGGKLSELATQLAARFEITDVEPALAKLVSSSGAAAAERVAALRALRQLKAKQLPELVEWALKSDTGALRSAARELLGELDPARAVSAARDVIQSGELAEQQAALAVLGTLRRPDAAKVLHQELEQLHAGKVPAALQLDVLTSAEKNGDDSLKSLIEAFKRDVAPKSQWHEYSVALEGGDALRGEQIFFNKAEVSCRRCHVVAGQGGAVGPELTKVGATQKREYLLESIVDPNKQIAKGFETTVLAMNDGRVLAGIIKADDGKSIQLIQPNGETVTVAAAEVEERATGKSGMPEDLTKKMSVGDLRDLVEYLSTLKGQGDAAHGARGKDAARTE